jgi:LmbE family N-acetylglucosaminyl deacetylase
MDHEKALSVLQALSNGTDPFSGQPFPAASPYQHPDIVRALYLAVRALETAVAAQKRQAARSTAAGNSGKPWAKDEDDQLVAAFDAGKSIDDLAVEHGRSRLAIEARLARFGKVPMPAGVRAIAGIQARESLRAQYSVRA